MSNEHIGLEFPVTVYGNLEKYNETISKGRCRIFYKGGNRNGAFITDEFADKLLATIPYAPVKGIYDSDEGDYTDHGAARTQGRIYGIVPENPNLTWEEHEDDDGVVRVYACVDVLIFTGLYAEANAIVGKPQSMEIYPPSIKGAWKFIDGKRYYVFEEGHFLGLQVLGDTTTPCFEGAAFFTLYENLKELLDKCQEYSLNEHNGGNTKMLNYKLSDGQKFHALWSLLNTNYNEACDWLIEYDICEVYDEYAIVKNYAEGIFERVYYVKNDETDSIELGERVRCFFVDVTEAEKNALDAVRAMNEGTYEKLDENYQAAKDEVVSINEKMGETVEALNTLNATYEEEKSNFETKFEELNGSIATLTTERDDANSKLEEVSSYVATLTNNVKELESFKAKIEKQQKQAVISKYAELLDEGILSTYSEKIDEYSAMDLEKDLAYELVKGNQSIFTNGAQIPGYIPKDEEPVSGLEEILSKYRKN